jgi:hypothetical protein
MYFRPDDQDGVCISKMHVDSVGSVAGYLHSGDVFIVLSVSEEPSCWDEEDNIKFLTILTTNGVLGKIVDRSRAWVYLQGL